MRRFLLNAFLTVLALVIIAIGLFVWAYFSVPAEITEAHDRELNINGPIIPLHSLAPERQALVATSGNLPNQTAEVLFFSSGYNPGPLHIMAIPRDLFALAIPYRLTAEDESELVLNHADFGPMDGKRVIGFSAASRTYFDRPLNAITDEQFDSLIRSAYHLPPQPLSSTH